MPDSLQRFKTTVRPGPRGRVCLELPFDPDAAWGAKGAHHITGLVGGRDVRGPLERQPDGGWVLSLGPAWQRGRGIGPGDEVEVLLRPEGPQRDSLAPDLAAALEADPEAGAFWDSLATFYRKAYLRWLDGSSRRPAVRAERISLWIELLKSGKKARD